MKLIYPALFYEFEDGEGFVVEFPDLPGCVTQGDSIEDALEMARDAASGWILTTIEDGEKVPGPSRYHDLSSDCSFFNYIELDIDDYAKKFSTKAVKKTLTIPQWLNTLAEKEEINFSQLLQNALKMELKLDLKSEDNLIGEVNSQEHKLILDKIYDLNNQFQEFNRGVAIAGCIANQISSWKVRSDEE